MKFVIPGQLPGMNEIIDAAKDHFAAYAEMKEVYTDMVGWLANKLPKHRKVAIIITWYEPNQKRDPDNISCGQKFILDGLVAVGTIPNDSQKYIRGILHRFRIDRENPRIEVEILDVEKCARSFEGQELWD